MNNLLYLKHYIFYGPNKNKFVPYKLKKVLYNVYFNKLFEYLLFFVIIDFIIIFMTLFRKEFYFLGIFGILLIKYNLGSDNIFFTDSVFDELIKYWIYKLFLNTIKMISLLIISNIIWIIDKNLLLERILNNIKDITFNKDLIDDYIEIQNDPYIGYYIFKNKYLTIKNYTLKIKVSYSFHETFNNYSDYVNLGEPYDVHFCEKKNDCKNPLINLFGQDLFICIISYFKSSHINKIFCNHKNNSGGLLKKLLIMPSIRFLEHDLI